MRLPRTFNTETLTFIAFFATLPLYSPNLVMFGDAEVAADLMPWFVDVMMVGCIVVGLGAAVWTAHRSDALFTKPTTIVAATILYIAGLVSFVAVLTIDALDVTMLAALSGLMVSVGVVPLCIAWGAYLALYDIRQALLHLAVMCGIAAMIELLLSSVAFEIGVALYLMLLVIGCALPCYRAMTNALDGDFRGYGEGLESEHPSARRKSLRSNVRAMASVAGMPFLGLMVFAFVMGLRKFVVFEVFYIEALGGMAASVVVLPLYFLKADKPFLPFLYQVFLPACALVLIALNSFPLGSIMQWLGATLSYVFFGIIGVLALASLCGMAHAREFSPASIYGLTVACFMLFSLLGVSLGGIPLVSDNAGPLLLVLCTLYFVFLVAAPLVLAWRRSSAPERDAAQMVQQGSDPLHAALNDRCRTLADAFGLSPRETEILSYLGRGHGIAYIAKTLVISESTVRTHVKSIYRKLQVSSREELLQLIDGDHPDRGGVKDAC